MHHSTQIAVFLQILCAVFVGVSSAEVGSSCGRNNGDIISIRSDLALAVCSDTIVRIVRGKDAASAMKNRESLVIDPREHHSKRFSQFSTDLDGGGNIFSLKTEKLLVQIDHVGESIALAFLDSSGDFLYTRELVDSKAQGDDGISNEVSVQQSWSSVPEESIYGGGYYVNNFLDFKGAPIHMVQMNLEVVIPFLASSRGYGILWDGYGETWLNPPRKSNQINLEPTARSREQSHETVATGTFTPPHSGSYWFSLDMRNDYYFNTNHHISLQIGGLQSKDGNTMTACNVTENNLPKVLLCKVDGLNQFNNYKVVLNYDSDQTPRVFWSFQDPTGPTTLQTKDTDFIDYYFMVGESSTGATQLDSVMSSYRSLTGSASMFSKKTYGFWQCKNHYQSQEELLEAAKQLRLHEIPVDNIVQDYMYWGDKGWGPQWDEKKYPDPAGMIKELHNEFSLSFMVSVWSKFDNTTSFFDEMKSQGYLLDDSTYFDAWNPGARALFFQFIENAHLSIGADALWLDATEPEYDNHLNKKIFLGTGNQFRNTYSLEVAKSFYEGFVSKIPKRPFSLTRSSFAGQHRYGSVVWTGDTVASFGCLRRHIAMSINYQLSGDPYWSMDIGGYLRPDDQYTSEKYKMLMIRWFQFGTFIPIMRVHGCHANTELWNYGNQTQSIIVQSALNLRYRLMPYIYSGFRLVEQNGFTMQRGLVFDFGFDPNVRSISDQFMFGSAFMVAPIHTVDSSRSYYLPQLDQGLWRDFYNGTVVAAGYHHASNVAPNKTLLFARSSIVVLAPISSHVHDPITLLSSEVRIYTGKDSSFSLFEDDGIDPSPSRPCTTIHFSWSENSSILRIGRLKGKSYPGMPSSRLFHIVVVRENHGAGVGETADPDATVQYTGKEIAVELGQSLEQVKK
ncbi:unnamed protein product [Cylindrotheca closterium]|uniref:Glycoside hydrolase family 31 N-terminal domain-containing protein n=1 Tax=Cylindrotheca closterium TaxID=2856 RepID=A0AAD2JII8_9STRA|nr:unnamed protein product [Cylindrotheca closterium]